MKGRRSTYRLAVITACLAGSLAMLSACDNSVNPFVEGERQPFAVFGYLDTAADTQFVRIEHVQADLSARDMLANRPSVGVINLDTGERAVWEDSAIVLEDGSRGLVYFSTMNVQPFATYQLEVARPGSTPTRTTTNVPGTTGIQVTTPSRNVVGDLQQTVIWQDIRRLSDVHMNYTVRALPTDEDTTFRLPYPSFISANAESYRTAVMLDRDYGTVRRRVHDAFGDTTIVLLGLSMSIVVPSAEWSARESGTNFENGSGFFASVGRFTESWSLDSTIVRSIGYRVP